MPCRDASQQGYAAFAMLDAAPCALMMPIFRRCRDAAIHGCYVAGGNSHKVAGHSCYADVDTLTMPCRCLPHYAAADAFFRAFTACDFSLLPLSPMPPLPLAITPLLRVILPPCRASAPLVSFYYVSLRRAAYGAAGCHAMLAAAPELPASRHDDYRRRRSVAAVIFTLPATPGLLRLPSTPP